MKAEGFRPCLAAMTLFLTAAAGPCFGQSVLTNGLIAWYTFDGNASDAGGNGFDGTISSNCWFIADRFGNTNHAIFVTNDQSSAEADTGRIDIPDAALNTGSAGTITAWVKPADITFSDIVAKQVNGFNTFAVFSIGGFAGDGGGHDLGTPGILYFHAQNSAAIVASTAAVTADTWQQVVVVFDTSACVFYINGVQCGTNAGDYSVPDWIGALTSIGCWRGDGWDGTQVSRCAFDDVRIYNRALSEEEVHQLYQAESGVTFGSPKLDLGKAVYVKFSDLNVGYNYQLQMSTDLLNWTDYGSLVDATNSSMVYPVFFPVDNWNQLFFRLH